MTGDQVAHLQGRCTPRPALHSPETGNNIITRLGVFTRVLPRPILWVSPPPQPRHVPGRECGKLEIAIAQDSPCKRAGGETNKALFRICAVNRAGIPFIPCFLGITISSKWVLATCTQILFYEAEEANARHHYGVH